MSTRKMQSNNLKVASTISRAWGLPLSVAEKYIKSLPKEEVKYLSETRSVFRFSFPNSYPQSEGMIKSILWVSYFAVLEQAIRKNNTDNYNLLFGMVSLNKGVSLEDISKFIYEKELQIRSENASELLLVEAAKKSPIGLKVMQYLADKKMQDSLGEEGLNLQWKLVEERVKKQPNTDLIKQYQERIYDIDERLVNLQNIFSIEFDGFDFESEKVKVVKDYLQKDFYKNKKDFASIKDALMYTVKINEEIDVFYLKNLLNLDTFKFKPYFTARYDFITIDEFGGTSVWVIPKGGLEEKGLMRRGGRVDQENYQNIDITDFDGFVNMY